jgi:hypothetical protein
MRKATFVRRLRRGGTRPPPTQGRSSTSAPNTLASVAIRRPAADVTSRRQHLRPALATVDAEFGTDRMWTIRAEKSLQNVLPLIHWPRGNAVLSLEVVPIRLRSSR